MDNDFVFTERDDYKEICKICKEKDEAIHNRDDEIYRLKQEINKQLKRSYSSLMMDMGSLQRSLSKELYIEDPVESLSAWLDDIKKKYGSDVVSMDTIGATQRKQTFNVDEDLESMKLFQ